MSGAETGWAPGGLGFGEDVAGEEEGGDEGCDCGEGVGDDVLGAVDFSDSAAKQVVGVAALFGFGEFALAGDG